MMLGQDTSQCGQRLLATVLVIARQKHDVFARSQAIGAFVNQRAVVSGGRQEKGADNEGIKYKTHVFDYSGYNRRES
jgi:hypothetical protein